VKIKIKKTDLPAASAAAGAAAGSSQFRNVNDVVSRSTIAYEAWRACARARERNDWPFVWDMSTADGPLRACCGPREEFPELCRRKLRPVAGITDAELRRIRLNGPDEAHLLQVHGHRERERRTYTAEHWVMLRGPNGWRVHAIDAKSFARDQREYTALVFEDFDAIELPAAFVEARDRAAEAARRKKAYKPDA
jgi:hypothetical protein